MKSDFLDPLKSIKDQIHLINQIVPPNIGDQFKAINSAASAAEFLTRDFAKYRGLVSASDLLRDRFSDDLMGISKGIADNLAIRKMVDFAGQSAASIINESSLAALTGVHSAARAFEVFDSKYYAGLSSVLNVSNAVTEKLAAVSSEQFSGVANINKAFMSAEISGLVNSVSENKVLWDAFKHLGASVSEERRFDAQYIESLEASFSEYENSNDKKSLLEFIESTPLQSKQIFLWLIISFLIFVKLVSVDVAVGLVSDEIKPRIKAFLSSNPETTNKQLSQLSVRHQNIDFEHIRFVGVSGLQVRMTPNNKGQVLDVLSRGDVIALLNKDTTLSWSFIRYKNDDNEIIQGWVFSRYLQKFNDKSPSD